MSTALNYTQGKQRSGNTAQRLMRNAKVMMVDDEPINMRVLQLHLTAEGYERFVSVSDSTQAMSVLRSEKPNVLLLDLQMPVVSGLDIIEMVRGDKALKQLPIIVLTSSNSSEVKVRALELGATDFLSKPVDASELALRMRNTLVARAYEQRIMHVDPLTNLPNRLYFSDYLYRRAKMPEDPARARVLVLLSLHRFKSINDGFGPGRGDDVLWAFSQRLRAAFFKPRKAGGQQAAEAEPPPLVMRLGGARFGVFMHVRSKPASDPRLIGALQNLSKSLQVPFVVDSRDVYISAGIGIAVHVESSHAVELLINQAETAIGQLSSDSTTSFSFYNEEMAAAAKRLLDIENAMHTAIEENSMYLVYQPKVNAMTGRIQGAEALLRWNHPRLGFISPEEFIPVAESSGLIVSVGYWVLAQACQQCAAIRKAGFTEFKMAVNVSIPQLYENEFAQSVQKILETTGLSSNALVIELTENMIMEDVEDSIARLSALRELGISISIDDFGTGYSSLSYLQRFPIDQLKIDRSFIMQIESAEDQSPIVKAVVMLAHDLNLTIVAEGVETQEQLEFIQKLECEEYQGYFKSRPVVAEQFMRLMDESDEKRAA